MDGSGVESVPRPAGPPVGRKALSAVVWNYGGAVLRALCQLVVQVLLARMLSPAVYGQFWLVMTVVGLGWILAESGAGATLVQAREVDQRRIGAAYGTVLLQGAVVGLLAGLAAPWIARGLNVPELAAPLVACAVLIPLQALANVPLSLLKRELDARRIQAIQLGAYVLGFGVIGLAGAWAGWGIWSLVAAFGVYTFTVALAGVACVPYKVRPHLGLDRESRVFGGKVLLSALAQWTYDNLDRIVVGRLWGTTGVGLYSVSQSLARAPATLLTHPLQSVAFASAARVRDDPARLRRGYVAAMNAVALVVVPVFAWLTVAASDLVPVLLGAQWEGAIPLLRAFALAMPFMIWAAVAGSFLWAIGKVGREATLQVLTAAVLVGGLAALGGLPLAQAAWVIPVAFGMRAVLVHEGVRRRIGASSGDAFRALAGPAVLAASGVSVWLLTSPYTDVPSLVLRAAAVAAVWIVVVAATQGRLLCSELRQAVRPHLPATPLGRCLATLAGL